MPGWLIERPTIFTLAILGAGLATFGSAMLRRASGGQVTRARLVLRTGYAITWASVALFIIAGFLSNR